MKSKRIGIVGWNTGENTFGVTKAYASFLANFGDLITLHPEKGVVDGIDLLVLPGGQDISPAIYGQVPNYYNSNPDLMKEYFFQNNLQQYIDQDVPIFGICLGMQQLFVHFGGELIQEIGNHPRSTESRGELVHKLEFQGEYRKHFHGDLSVNSLHHQAADPDTLPECLEIVAFSKCTGKRQEAVEIIRHTELPIWGVQYHPEEIWDTTSVRIITELLKYERVQQA